MFWTLVTAVAVFSIAVIAMAVGVILGNRRIKGSCGGLANLRDADGRTLCDACTNPSPDCQGNPRENPTGVAADDEVGQRRQQDSTSTRFDASGVQ